MVILLDNGIVDWGFVGVVLDYGGFVLVGDVNCFDFLVFFFGCVYGIVGCGEDCCLDYFRIVFDLVGMWVDLCEFGLG